MGEKEAYMYRVLVVDDDPMVTRLVRINLELEQFEVEEAWDGKTAMKILRESPPDLLVLDIMMPQMDGWEILKQMRDDEGLKELPVVILTAKVQDENIAKGWRMGADGYIVKPFNPVNLAESLNAVLSSSYEERLARREVEIARMKDIYLEE
ncbi:MAG: response regulator [Actinobacteria bacterium]|nr:MAG: response regulator [Actinomycetota bacterium]